MSEKLSKTLIIIGAIFFILSIVFFSWESLRFSVNRPIDAERFNQFGSFISGIVGTIWALAGVILFYVALQEQRKDIQINQLNLTTQTEALKQQIREFELQRQELEETRSVFKEQSKTQKYQRFENTFFQILSVHHQNVNSLVGQPKSGHPAPQGRNCFKFYHSDFQKLVSTALNETPNHDKSKIDIIAQYVKYFKTNDSDLGHYFRTLYHIVKLVKNSEIDEQDKRKYTNIVRAQLSSYELILLYYNCLSQYGVEKFKPLIEEFGLLKNMDSRHLLKEFSPKIQYSESAFK